MNERSRLINLYCLERQLRIIQHILNILKVVICRHKPIKHFVEQKPFQVSILASTWPSVLRLILVSTDYSYKLLNKVASNKLLLFCLNVD